MTIETADSRTWVSFSPTSRFSFVSPGDAEAPEFFEERSGKGDGPPLHRHPWPNWELVLSGTIRVIIDDEEFLVEAGSTVYTPPGAVHTYVVESDEAHIVGVGTSGGRFHQLQSKAPELLMAGDMERLGAFAGSLDVELLGPPLSA
ncbi:MAG: hypothetical protein DHS20C19_07720 [Acidimicrobiales bacterium]|nr:MAG: hypothetical protein DHS20C19_07720 [Acidimicrobiales bacterium]